MDKNRIDIILDALNISDEYSFLNPVEETELYLKNAYSRILGVEALEDSLKMVGDPKRHLSNWDSILQDEITNQELSNKEAYEVISKIVKQNTKNWRLIFLIRRAAEMGEIEFADRLTLELPDNNDYSACQYVANREIIRNLVDVIDLKEFKKRLKLCKPAKTPKNHVVGIKNSFIKFQSLRNSWEEAYKIAKDKLFGESYYHEVLFPETKNRSIKEMNELIDKQAELNGLAFLKARVFTKYAYYDKPLFPDDKTFTIIYSELEKVDKTYKENGNRLRDMLAFDLGCSTEDIKKIKMCKKLITNPMTNRELGYHLENVKSS